MRYQALNAFKTIVSTLVLSINFFQLVEKFYYKKFIPIYRES